MNKTLKAGTFVVIAILILITGWIWLANVQFGGKRYKVVVNFPDVTGLLTDDPVRVFGIEKGKVIKIEFKESYVEVVLLLDQKVKLYSDAYAEILDIAMISGTKYLKLHPGKSGIPFNLNTVIPGKPSLGIPFSMIGDLGEKIGKLLSIVESTDLMHSLGLTLRNLQSATSHLSQIVKENQADLRATTKSLKEVTADLGELGDKISSTAEHADSLLCDIKRGKGTLGKLATEDSLYQELNSTLMAIKELAQDIKANPKRYLKIF